MKLPPDYIQQVYAGVLGKIIGVYLGRPFEGWGHRDILAKLGEVNYYVNEKLNAPLIVTDDDISGTFTFLRALEDYGNSKDLTARQIGQSWLNYIIENRTILWWGGMGMSTEHTAFMRLKHGIPAPRSGSIEMNGTVVAEQIGSQIFIDGWAMVAPGDPELAVSFARRASSVSHDGEAIHGAQVIAAMESIAFVETDLNKILDSAVGFIPKDSVIYRMIADLRSFHAREKTDWRKAFTDVMERNYGYDKFGGNCHMVPNHGVIILALLYGQDNFQKSLMIANTCGWDTDCNSGNVGCFMGIKNGLKGIDAGPDWRGPVRDKMFLPTAEGGSCITDALTQAYKIANMGAALVGEKPVKPKNGARFHFSLPGSVQGFSGENSEQCKGIVSEVANSDGWLCVTFKDLQAGCFARVATPTFISPNLAMQPGYGMMACPTIYSGQRARASIRVEKSNVANVPIDARLFIRFNGEKDQPTIAHGPAVHLAGKAFETIEMTIPDTQGQPIYEIGIELSSSGASGTLLVDYLTWDGEPNLTFRGAIDGTRAWKSAWVDAAGSFHTWGFTKVGQKFMMTQNEDRGMVIQGTRDWKNYRVTTEITPHLATNAGIAARVQGLKRFYALLLCNDGKARLIKALDGDNILATHAFQFELGRTYKLSLEVKLNRIRGWIDDQAIFDVTDTERALTDGAIGLVAEDGRVLAGEISVMPVLV